MSDTYDRGMEVRRAVLGDEHVDALAPFAVRKRERAEALRLLRVVNLKDAIGDDAAARASYEQVLSAAFLVNRSNWLQFMDHAEELGHRFSDLVFDVTGPWPPYHFIEEAR